MRLYHYKELLKLFAMNFNSTEFRSARSSIYCFLTVPSVVALTFRVISPFSVLRSIAVWSTFGATVLSFGMNLSDELH